MTEVDTASAKQPSEAKRSHPSWRVNLIAEALEGDRRVGDRARLRRMDPKAMDASVFWEIVVRHVEPAHHAFRGAEGEPAPLGDRTLRRWAVILQGLAYLIPFHRSGARLGAALAGADIHELRVLRLLRAHDDALHGLIPKLAHQLANKVTHVDWAEVARLVLDDGGDRDEKHRRQIARDYYSHSLKKTSSDKDATDSP